MSAENEFWIRWHAEYNDPASPRSQRLATVQRQLRSALDAAPSGEIRLLSMCAGKGGDVLGVLADHPRARDVRARLVERSPELVAEGQAAIAELGLTGVEMVEGDAASTDMYAAVVPAHVMLVCGVFGSISEQEIEATVNELPHLGTRDSVAIWTKQSSPPDLRGWVRQAFLTAGFEEVAYDTDEKGTNFAVGSSRWTAEPRPFRPGRRLFVFRDRA